MMINRLAKFPMALLAVAAGILLFTGCHKNDAPAALYESAPVKKGDISQVVTASGTLNALISVDVGSQISGRILSLNADFNSKVKKGDLVAEIETDIYKAALNQCAGEVQSSKAALEMSVSISATRSPFFTLE